MHCSKLVLNRTNDFIICSYKLLVIFFKSLRFSYRFSSVIVVSGQNHNTIGRFVSTTHPARGRRDDVVATYFCLPQQRGMYVSNETPNDVQVKRRQVVSVVRLQDVIKERRDNVSRVCNSDIPLARLHDVSDQSQMKHPTTSWWYIAKACQWYVSTTLHKNVVATSQRYLRTMSQVNPK